MRRVVEPWGRVRLQLVGVAVVASLAASACAGERPSVGEEGVSREAEPTTSLPTERPTSEAPTPGADTDSEVELRIAVAAPWRGDPADAGPSSLALRVLADLQFEGLVSLDSAGTPVPALAEGWTVSPDRLTWTFTIGDHAVDHSGEPITARDVKLSFDRLAARGPNDVVASSLMMVSGWTDRMTGTAGGVAGITAPLDNRVVIRLDSPFEPLPWVLASPAFGIAAQRDGELIGTGAYRPDDRSDRSTGGRLDLAGATLIAVDPRSEVGRILIVDASTTDGARLMADDQVDWAVLAPSSATDGLPGDVVRVPLDLSIGLSIRFAAGDERRAIGDVVNTLELAQTLDLALVPPTLAEGPRGDLPGEVVIDLPVGWLERLGPEFSDQFAAAGVAAVVVTSEPAEFARRVAEGEATVFPVVVAGGTWDGGGVTSALLPNGIDDALGIESADRAATVGSIVAELDPTTRALFSDTLVQSAVDEGVFLMIGQLEARVGVGPAAQGLLHRSDGTLDLSGVAS